MRENLPLAMRYVKCLSIGKPDVMQLTEGPVPHPAEGEVLIRVAAAGVNRPDVQQRAGVYPMAVGANPILGLEVAGVVAASGTGVVGFSVGDRVCALTNGGGYAEYCAVPFTQTLPIPANLDMVSAAAIPETYFTVWANLFESGGLTAGKTVLVHGGASGIGSTAIQLAKAFNARVFATAGGPDKCSACLTLGADLAIDYKTEDFVGPVLQATGGQGVDVVLDIMGASYFDRNIACLGKDGRLVIIGFTGGDTVPTFPLGPVVAKRLMITGSAMRPRTASEKAGIASALQNTVWPLLAAGRCLPIIHDVMPMNDVVGAHRLMESGQHIGKIILSVASTL